MVPRSTGSTRGSGRYASIGLEVGPLLSATNPRQSEGVRRCCAEAVCAEATPYDMETFNAHARRTGAANRFMA